MALMGYSYGGEMAGFVEGKTDRFKAIISGAPVIDQFSEYGTEGGSWYDRWYFGKPWEHMDDAWRQSPLAGAANAKTPFCSCRARAIPPIRWASPKRCIARCGRKACRSNWSPIRARIMARSPIGIFGRPSPEPWHGFDARQRVVNFINAAFSATPPPATAPASSK